jgi:hypothetical protein
MITELKSKDELVAHIYDLNELKENCFPTPADKTFQFGCSIEKNDRVIKTHIHKKNKRIINSTSEFIYVIEGSMFLKIYDENEIFINEVTLNKNMALLQFSGGHSINIKRNTKYFELKQGPYKGRDYDKYDLD